MTTLIDKVNFGKKLLLERIFYSDKKDNPLRSIMSINIYIPKNRAP